MAHELAIVTMFRNEAPYLKEWIEYHRMVGVEHFWLFNNESTDNWEDILKPYMDEGVVEVIYKPLDYGGLHIPGAYVTTQLSAFKDGLVLAKENTKWVALIDIDEFLLPMKDKTVTQCLQNHFTEAAGVFVTWRNFGTGGIYVPVGTPLLFKLTACSMKSHSNNAIGKSIVRPNLVSLANIWSPHHFFLTSGSYWNSDGKPMVFDETNLKTDGMHHDKFIRINHYVLRDESFYQNSRLPLTRDKKLLMEHYEAFSLVHDSKMMDFIQKYHPISYEKIWKQYQ